MSATEPATGNRSDRSAFSGQQTSDGLEGHGLGVVPEREVFVPGVNDELALRLKVLAGDIESLLRMGGKAAFDLDRPKAAIGKA